MKMLNKLAKVLINGLPWGLAFFALSFMLGYTFHVPLEAYLLSATIIASAALIINGLLYSRFTKPLKKLQAITATFTDAEVLKLQAPANHYIDDHMISGKLYLTDKRILFKSFQQEEYTWPVNELLPLKFHPSIFNSGGVFIVKGIDDGKLVFEVDEIRQWKKALLAAWEEQDAKLAIG